MYHSKKIKHLIVIMIVCFGALFMSACSGEGEEAADPSAAENATEAEKDAYEEYIRNALANVNGENPTAQVTPQSEDPNSTATPSPTKDQPTQSVQTDRTAPNDPYVSSMESPITDTDPFSMYNNPITFDTSSSSSSSTSSSTEAPSPSPTGTGTPTPTPTPYITPDEFEVGKCCIYMNGESDSAFGTEIISAINKVRKDLGYKELVTNKGLSTCADRRTRESAASMSHIRPNGQPFYSLAPEHFKAEMLLCHNSKAEQLVDDMIKRDPLSKSLIFTEKYQSIGASSFKCNGLQYSVVSFGL